MFNHALQIQAKLVFTNETLLWNIVKPKPTVPHRSCFHSSEEDSGLSEALCDATVSQNKSFQKRMTEMTDEIFFSNKWNIHFLLLFDKMCSKCRKAAEASCYSLKTALHLWLLHAFFFFFLRIYYQLYNWRSVLVSCLSMVITVRSNSKKCLNFPHQQHSEVKK